MTRTPLSLAPSAGVIAPRGGDASSGAGAAPDVDATSDDREPLHAASTNKATAVVQGLPLHRVCEVFEIIRARSAAGVPDSFPAFVLISFGR